jgi:hypothetical protein
VPKAAAIVTNLANNRLNASIVLYNLDEAKAKLASANIEERIATSILSLGSGRPMVASALVELVCSDATAKSIGARYSLCPSAIHYWSKRVGLPDRQRGARPLLQPRPKHVRILELVSKVGIPETARRAGVSRQHVHQIVCRWAPDLRSRRALPRLKVLPRSTKGQPRNIVVSFRLSREQWARLLAAAPVAGAENQSGFGKARAIVLNYISSPGRGGCRPTDACAHSAHEYAEMENVYNRNIA